MSLVIFFFFVLQFVTRISGLTNCLVNDYFETFHVVQPLNNSIVAKYFYYSATSTSKIPEQIINRQSEFFFCWKIGSVERCGDSIFDSNNNRIDLPPELSTMEDTPIFVKISLCNTSVCFCKDTLHLLCCINDANISAAYALAEDSSVSAYQKQIQRQQQPMLDYDRFHSNTKSPLLFIVVKSTSLHFEQRMEIRNSYLRCSYWLKDTMALAFIIGQSKRPEILNSLEIENMYFKDMLLGRDLKRPVLDSYHSLVDKVIYSLEWLFQSPDDIDSSMIKYVVVSDDDVFINMFELRKLLDEAPVSGYYAGEVLQDRLNHTMKPQRDPNHRNYLSVESYASHTFPRFALGNFYLLSRDLVQTLLVHATEAEAGASKCPGALSCPTGDLEDVSVAVWLKSAADIDVINVPAVISDPSQILNNFVAVANIRDMNMFRSIDQALTSYHRSLSTSSTIETLPPGISVSEIVSSSSSSSSSSQQSRLLTVVVSDSATYAITFLHALLGQLYSHVNLQIITVEQYGRGGDYAAGVDVLVMSPNDGYQGKSFQSLGNRAGAASSASPGHHQHWDSTGSTWPAYHSRYLQYLISSTAPCRVIVISGEPFNLSSISTLSNSRGCEHRVGAEISGHEYTNHRPGGVDLLITTTTQADHLPPLCQIHSYKSWVEKHRHSWSDLAHYPHDLFKLLHVVYVPVSSIMFSEMATLTTAQYSPQDLLQPRGYHWAEHVDMMRSKLFNNEQTIVARVAYMYSNCHGGSPPLYLNCTYCFAAPDVSNINQDNSRNSWCVGCRKMGLRNLRELFMLKLSWALPGAVQALGVCQGLGKRPHLQHGPNRRSRQYLQDAVDIYKAYQFVIAFENSQVDGYTTEKLVLPYLAHSVPIYLGPADTSLFFNRKSMVDCSVLGDLDECVAAVVALVHNKTAYLGLLAEQPMINMKNWENLFDWHVH